MYGTHSGKRRANQLFEAALLLSAIVVSMSGASRANASQGALTAPSSIPPCPAGQCFTDVPPGSSFFDFANRLYQQGIMTGYVCGGAGEPCDPANRPYFRPGSGVTRGQMTKFVDNARRLPGIAIDSNEPTIPINARNTFTGGVAINGASTSGGGVIGSSESGTGVSGLSDSGDGVYGYSTNYEGIRGETGSNYAGVYGHNTSTGGIGPGLRGDSSTGPGIYGLSDVNAGVWGKSANSYGVRAESDNTIALYAATAGNGSTAVYGTSTSGRGVYGSSSDATHEGVEGYNSAGGTGVSAYTTGAGYALYADNTDSGGYAGYFAGNLHVTGSCCEAAAGTFKIDHPLDPQNKYLTQSAVESPDMLDIYTGSITTDAEGNATVNLPTYCEALNRDFRYQLTVVGQFAQAVVMSEIQNNSFGIKTDKPKVRVSWQVTGIRHDAYAEQHPVTVEQTKPEAEKGTYLYPELYGQPASTGVGYEMEQHVQQP